VRPPAYFPVDAEPLQMVASLARFGTDYGQGAFDHAFFQVDSQRAEFVRQKRAAPPERRFVVGDDALAQDARAEALEWMHATLAREHPSILRDILGDDEAADPFDAVARHIQEDFAVLQAGENDAGRTLVVDVRFPSGWRPERLVEAGFDANHAPVPGFPPHAKASQGMVRAMVDRGPYVRFVWTVGADDVLDHHPDKGDRRQGWDHAVQAFFRVERQVTVPLPRTRSSVFLVRTHVRPLLSLDDEQLDTVRQALDVMPPEVRRYKSLPDAQVFERFAERAT
jgi:hypothetical protein